MLERGRGGGGEGLKVVEGRGGGGGKGCARGVERGRRRIEEKEGCWRGVEGKEEKYQVNECTAAVDYFTV